MAALHLLLPTGESIRTQEFRFQTNLPSPARRGSRSRPPLRRPRPLRFARLRVPVWNPYSRGRLGPAKSEDRKGGEGKIDANLTNFLSTDPAGCRPRRPDSGNAFLVANCATRLLCSLLQAQALLSLGVVSRKSFALVRGRVEEANVATGVDAERLQRLAIVDAAKKVVPPADFFADCEVQRQHEVGDFYVVDRVGLRLHRVAHLKPVEHGLLRVGGVRALHEEIGFRIVRSFNFSVHRSSAPTPLIRHGN